MKKITVLHSDDPTIERTNRAYPDTPGFNPTLRCSSPVWSMRC